MQCSVRCSSVSPPSLTTDAWPLVSDGTIEAYEFVRRGSPSEIAIAGMHDSTWVPSTLRWFGMAGPKADPITVAQVPSDLDRSTGSCSDASFLSGCGAERLLFCSLDWPGCYYHLGYEVLSLCSARPHDVQPQLGHVPDALRTCTSIQQMSIIRGIYVAISGNFQYMIHQHRSVKAWCNGDAHFVFAEQMIF